MREYAPGSATGGEAEAQAASAIRLRNRASMAHRGNDCFWV